MALIVKKGVVSNLSRATNNIGRNGNNQTIQEYSWRFENMQCLGKVGANIGLSEGDELIVVGKMKNGIFNVKGLKNLTSGAIVKSQFTIPLIAGICFVCLGFLTLILLVGFVLIPIGIYYLYETYLAYKANNLLESAT
jgi:hypothetical protein